MNTESMPLKHDHQQYADHPAAATTRTTLVTRAIVVMCGVAAVVAGVTYLSTGVVYPRSPVVTHHRDRSPEDVLSVRPYSSITCWHPTFSFCVCVCADRARFAIFLSYVDIFRFVLCLWSHRMTDSCLSLSSSHFPFFFLLCEVGCYW